MRYLRIFALTFIISVGMLGVPPNNARASVGGCIVGGATGDQGHRTTMSCTNCDPPWQVAVCAGTDSGCDYSGWWQCPPPKGPGGFLE